MKEHDKTMIELLHKLADDAKVVEAFVTVYGNRGIHWPTAMELLQNDLQDIREYAGNPTTLN